MILICFYGSSARAQVPDYLEAGTEWSENIVFVELPCTNQYQTIYYLNGDSTVAGQTYQKLYRRGEKLRHVYQASPGGATACAAPVVYFNEFNLLIRQEMQRLYVYHPDYGDTLLYDFDLEVGDTVSATINHFPVQVVSSIDSIAFGNGYRKVFHLGNTFLIEGMGSNNGLKQFLNSHNDLENPLSLYNRCYRNNHGTYTSDGESCYWTMDVSETALPHAVLNAFPNPTENLVKITSSISLQDIQSVEVTDLLGKIVPATYLTSGESSIEINLKPFLSGLYLVRIKTSSGWYPGIRVMKE